MKTILIVDDQRGIRLLLEELFKQSSYNTIIAATGEEALQFIQQEVPDCILLDIKMPKMDGLEFLKRIRTQNLSTPVFIMTAYENTQQLGEAEKLGFNKVFTKPFDIFTVLEEVNALF